MRAKEVGPGRMREIRNSHSSDGDDESSNAHLADLPGGWLPGWATFLFVIVWIRKGFKFVYGWRHGDEGLSPS